jgi:hypothetical protein
MSDNFNASAKQHLHSTAVTNGNGHHHHAVSSSMGILKNNFDDDMTPRASHHNQHHHHQQQPQQQQQQFSSQQTSASLTKPLSQNSDSVQSYTRSGKNFKENKSYSLCCFINFTLFC